MSLRDFLGFDPDERDNEEKVYTSVKEKKRSFIGRLDGLEMKIFGKISDDPMLTRLENLEKNGYLIKSKTSRAACYMTNPEVVEES
mgnify:CR=1 FL=1